MTDVAYNYYPTYYQPPMADQLTQYRQQQYTMPQAAPQPQPSPILWVQGEEGAKAYMVAPGASVLLMDSESSSFYIKSTDASGMPQPLRIFDYTERTAAQHSPSTAPEYITRDEFERRIAQLTPEKPVRVKRKEDTEDA